jgi:hypothetical protein
MAEDFKTIRLARNAYLHNWSTDQSEFPAIAVQCYAGAIRLLQSTMSITFEDGRVRLSEEFRNYLRSRGAIQEDESSE